ncbi:MAG: hypothetical protein U0M42_06290 [Acutalibacteraceae bacterium]|nr:hypothetical protein [Acutalibacteraceae bacterium]
MELNNYRNKYGKFNIKMYLFQLIGIIVSSLLAVLIAYCERQYIFISLLIWIYNICWVLVIISPYLEKYHIDYPNIYIQKLTKSNIIKIPEQYSLIISSMEIRPILSIQGFHSNSYCVSVVNSNNLSEITGLLHQKYVKKYSNSTIKGNLGNLFITDFVYDKSLPFDLFQKASFVIIPKTINNFLELSGTNIICDTQY